jgi:hypothetical protein
MRLSDIEPRFVCATCGKRGADELTLDEIDNVAGGAIFAPQGNPPPPASADPVVETS